MERNAELSPVRTIHEDLFEGVEFPAHTDSNLYMKSCGIQRCIPGSSFQHNSKDGFYLHAVLSGKGFLKVDGKVFDIHEGQLFLLREDKDTYYEADTDSPWHYVWIAFCGEHAHRYMHYAGFVEDTYVQDCHVSTRAFYDLVKEIMEHPHLSISYELYRMSLALRFLSLAIESREAGKDGPQQRDDLSPDDYVAYAARYIQSNYSKIRISDVASYIGINRTYLTTLFKRKMLMSPQEFLMHVRMDKSRSLLRLTNMSVSAVAKEVGYEDQLAFSKIFKKKFGVSPAQYRKKILEENRKPFSVTLQGLKENQGIPD